MTSPTPGLAQIKERMRAAWIAGDFGRIAEPQAAEGAAFADRLTVAPGARVLDVACGTGNVTLPLARKGAHTFGLDIAPNLLEQARARAKAEYLDITFDEGDAESLPYAAESFDLVTSMFGAMFAPRPDAVAGELMRVCRLGGTVAMANWTPEGFTGQMFRVSAQYMPLPPNIPAPVLWGNADIARQRLAPWAAQIHFERRPMTFRFDMPPHAVVGWFREYFGPMHTAFARLDEPGRLAFAADLTQLWSDHNQAADGGTVVPTEYLQVTAVRS